MGIGTAVRHRLGRWEIPAAELYRRVFINLDDFVAQVRPLAPAARILEIGCGDGAMAGRLVRAYPQAHYVGIDVAPTAGRLFRGDTGRAEFRVLSTEELRARRPEPFDLVLIVDVIHHIPAALRVPVLRDAGALLAPAGTLVIKEFARRPLLSYYATYLADRYGTGDKGVSFLSVAQLRELSAAALPGFELVHSGLVRPWRNNVMHALRRAG